MCHYCRCRWISLIYLEIENDRIRNEYGCDNTKNMQHVTMSYKWDLICSTIGFTDISNNSKDSSRGQTSGFLRVEQLIYRDIGHQPLHSGFLHPHTR